MAALKLVQIRLRAVIKGLGFGFTPALINQFNMSVVAFQILRVITTRQFCCCGKTIGAAAQPAGSVVAKRLAFG